MDDNPFLFGKPVGGTFFCDRRRELRRLAVLFRSPNSAWLLSPRRYGKTSLIREAFELAEGESFHTAYVDLYPLQAGRLFVRPLLAGIGPLVLGMAGTAERALQVLRSLARSFVPALTVDDLGKPALTFSAAGPPGPEPEVEEVVDLPQRLAERYDTRVVVALDEFQAVAKVSRLEARLRGVMQHQDRVSYVLAGSRPSVLREMVSSPDRPFYQFGELIPLGRIEPPELLRYVSGRFESAGRPVAPATARRIVEVGAGHPHFTQYLASVVWSLLAEGVPEGDGLLAHGMERIAAALDAGFRPLFESLSAAQRRVLVEVAIRGGRELLAERRRLAGGLGGASTVASALAALVRRDILEREGAEHRFVDPALGLWLVEQVVDGAP